ncbi:MAG: Rieske 2Fe-2S domain-containing protein [Gammaproteobacteria bacterium]|nr:Rieske 2Fe-2S domain-containing protein [Gammaproteobacteria bacterium]
MNQPNEYHNRFSSQYPDLGHETIEIEKYFSKAAFELEREKIFKKVWLQMGRVEHIPKPGDYMVKELEFANTSIVLVRGEDNKIRGFHNMCAHRSNRVACHAKGNTGRGFACRFHGWTYGLDGGLIHIPEEGLFPTLDKSTKRLKPVATDVWEGFIFINLDPQPTETLREYLGPELVDQYQGHFNNMASTVTYTIDIKCNWKIFLDAFVETYHFAFVHKATAAGSITSEDNPYGFMDAARIYDRHRVISARANRGYTPTPTELLITQFGGHQTLNPDFENAAKRTLPPGINPGKLDDWSTDILILFPLCNIQPLDGWYVNHNYWPVDYNTTRWEQTSYMSPATDAGSWLAQEYNHAYLRDLLREDFNNLEMIQSNLESGAQTEMVFGDQEIMLRHAYKVIDDYLSR